MTAKQSIFEKCPSGIHREFFDYAFKFFEGKGCKAILKGSIHKNTANTFSDIDLILKGMRNVAPFVALLLLFFL